MRRFQSVALAISFRLRRHLNAEDVKHLFKSYEQTVGVDRGTEEADSAEKHCAAWRSASVDFAQKLGK
jgi:hypothetical protein